MVTTRKKSPVKSKPKPKVVASRRMTLIKAGVTNLNKLPSYQKSKTKVLSKNVPSKNTTVTRNAPNPYAPKYTWAPWGTSGVVHDNCYDYAFGSFSNDRQSKSVPGDRSGLRANGLTFRTCDGIAKRVLSDNPGTVYKM